MRFISRAVARAARQRRAEACATRCHGNAMAQLMAGASPLEFPRSEGAVRAGGQLGLFAELPPRAGRRAAQAGLGVLPVHRLGRLPPDVRWDTKQEAVERFTDGKSARSARIMHLKPCATTGAARAARRNSSERTVPHREGGRVRLTFAGPGTALRAGQPAGGRGEFPVLNAAGSRLLRHQPEQKKAAVQR